MKLPIDRKERIDLGGVKQTIHIWGTKEENPVVLFLHGGPGVPNRHGMAKNHMDLLDDFTIVAWDQRGTGGSYFGCDPETLTLEQLAEEAHMNKYYLSHTFKREYGVSPINYLISRRIEESKYLLAETDLSMSHIAQLLGFSSLSYFSQVFRKTQASSPLEYRQSVKQI